MHTSTNSRGPRTASVRDARTRGHMLADIIAKAHIGLVDSYLGDLDWRIKENSNMGYSLQGLNNFIASEVSKTY